MTKLDADLRALYELLSTGGPDLAERAPTLAGVVQTARQALDERAATIFDEGHTSTTGFTERVTLPDAQPLHLHVTITAALDEPKPDRKLERRADQMVEALEEAFRGQVRLLRATLD